MKWMLTLCGIVLCLWGVAQAEDQPPVKEKPMPAATTAPTKKTVPKLIPFNELKFAKPEFSVLLQQWEKLATELADETWERGEWCQPEGIPDFRTWWSSHPGTHDPLGSTTSRSPAGKAVHEISIKALGDVWNKNPTVQVVSVTASWYPPEPGWGAMLWYREGTERFSSGNNSGFLLVQVKPGENWSYGSRLTSNKELTYYQTMQTFGDTDYYVFVGLRGERDPMAEISEEQIRVWLAGPESFRFAALARLAAIDALIESELPANLGIDARLPADNGKRIHQLRLRRSARPLSEEELNQLLTTAHAELAQRKEHIEQNYKEMHAALTNTFPLRRLLDLPKATQRRPPN